MCKFVTALSRRGANSDAENAKGDNAPRIFSIATETQGANFQV